MRAFALVFALLLVLSSVPAGAFAPGVEQGPEPALVGGADRPTVQETGEETRVLAIPEGDVGSSTAAVQAVDLGPSVGADADRFGFRLSNGAVERRIESAETNGDRQRRILEELSRVEQQVITLNEREQEVISAYAAGEIGAQTAVVRLARISAEAEALGERVRLLNRLAEETPDFSLDSSRTNQLRFELERFEGPVREHALAIARGEREPDRIFVEASAEGIVLSAVIDDEYVREAYRSDLRDRTVRTVDEEGAQRAVEESYPQIWATRRGPETIGSGSIYAVTVPHDRGTLVAYVDSGSGEVFQEIQRQPVDAAVLGPIERKTMDGLNVTVNRAYPGGPLRVTVTDAETDEPVDATITIGQGGQESETVGTTGSDGTLWTVAPRSEFTVAAFGTGTTVAVIDVMPRATPGIGVDPGGPDGENGGNETDENTSASLATRPDFL